MTVPVSCCGCASRRGFTFMEVLCLLLVFGMGLVGVIALVLYGSTVAGRVRGMTLGMSTAVTLARDPTPLLPAAVAGDWSYSDYLATFDNTTTRQESLAKGYLNGFYVVRSEYSLPADVIRAPGGAGPVYVRSAHVSVDVYEAVRGRLVASYTTRILRQRGRE